ncbi:apoptosis-inducing TAF9-like domain 1 family protein [Penicillium hispanicum]|uniref:apoptosis-inducing TAF9-like domain 1 family protein n=1 Tax=Penicillium hispanicum TaxID=1080232 RepID=UPI002540BE50|nr:apoptosis-inducing TAF9-like domain 1 family protein [Penicillium hispanicum]KAJ5584856.1 apoptosis-inducing TAF9-like domain 1 family protein [Penicillium hispanicum]
MSSNAEQNEEYSLEEVSVMLFCLWYLLGSCQIQQRLKAHLWLNIGKIVDEETFNLGINATPQFIAALTELVWAQIETASIDIESFAKHAGRSTVNVSDVLMLGRRNEGLDQILRAFIDHQREEAS